MTSDLAPQQVTEFPSPPALRTGPAPPHPPPRTGVPGGARPRRGDRTAPAPRCAAAFSRRARWCGRAFPLRARGGSARDEGSEPPTRAASLPPVRPLGAAASHVYRPPHLRASLPEGVTLPRTRQPGCGAHQWARPLTSLPGPSPSRVRGLRPGRPGRGVG